MPSSIARIGRRVHALREARGLSLRDLAKVSRVSAPMLSQVERGETSPTIAVAARIADGLGLSLSQLLRLDESGTVTVRRADRRRAIRRNGHRVEELSSGQPGDRTTVSLHVLKPGARTGGASDPPMHSPGARETVYVRSGTLALIVDEDRHELGEGDAATFDADLPHRFENPGSEQTTFIAVVTAGLRST